MASVRFADSTTPTHHRFPSIEHIPRPQSTHLDLRYPARYLTLSHDSTAHRTADHHHHHAHQQHHHRHEKPRPSSISRLPLPPSAHQLKQPLVRPSKPAPAGRPRTQSLTEPSAKLPPPSSSAAHHRSWIVPINPLLHASRTPSPSPSPARHSIAAIKKTLVETIDAFPCPLEDKLTLVAKLHAEVEAELTQLSELAGPPLASTYLDYADRSSGHSRKKIEDTVRFIKHADRIKAHALQQLKQDISHSQTPALHPALPAHSHHHPSHQAPAAHSSSRLALLSRELH
ncbi:hypothetical protein, variant [Puccinia triticina 1-1 BBBD Race 1]|uniref:Uncharacterized protein n=1 Tax=Puccinia triticina (isolate 1-1 / race 1 (BBBD)) TaxID=630390 RepID=A0A180GQK3_PUCT1|nr:hypothetical protein PTTG_04219 [Puccinia triticina 1-1 BBBD Race 1]OAV94708.1 hypothetical protein, variant [Puccinia triticina 1-1 BBBD Race 1]